MNVDFCYDFKCILPLVKYQVKKNAEIYSTINHTGF